MFKMTCSEVFFVTIPQFYKNQTLKIPKIMTKTITITFIEVMTNSKREVT